MAKRLIDDGEARRRIIAFATGLHSTVLPVDTVMMLIAQVPAVDAVEVVHGQWVDRIDNDTPMHECSACGARVVKGLYEYENPNLYCYHCGANMDSEADHE